MEWVPHEEVVVAMVALLLELAEANDVVVALEEGLRVLVEGENVEVV